MIHLVPRYAYPIHQDPRIGKRFEYTGLNGKQCKLSTKDLNMLRCIPSYIVHLQNDHGPGTPYYRSIEPLDIKIADFLYYFKEVHDPLHPVTIDNRIADSRLKMWEVSRLNLHQAPTPQPKSQSYKKNILDYDDLTKGTE